MRGAALPVQARLRCGTLSLAVPSLRERKRVRSQCPSTAAGAEKEGKAAQE